MKLAHIILVVGLLSIDALAYTPPKGIPNPADHFPLFGEIDQATPSWPASWLTPTTSETADHYFVDKTHASATNSGNAFGHPDKPRTSMPEGNMVAGSFVYVDAGTYTGVDSGGDRFDWSGAGTATNPIWVTGNPTAKPVLQDDVHIGLAGAASYIVFENFEISGLAGASLKIYPQTDGDHVDHILARNCTLTGTGTAADPSGVLVGISQSNDTIPNSTITQVVGYNLAISNFGDPTSSDEAGFYNGYHTDYVWILDSEINGVGSDSIAGSHYSNGTTRKTEHYFIGRNTCYGNGENGVDLKGVRYAVVSENTIYGPFVREQGWGIVLHSGAAPATPTRDCWIIFNTIHHCSGGVYSSATNGGQDISIVGNLIYDIDADYAALADNVNGRAIQIRGEFTGAAHIVDNTLLDYDTGIFVDDIDVGDSVEIHGNILSGRREADRFDLQVSSNGDEARVNVNYNLWYQGNGAPRIRWAGGDRSFTYMQTIAGECAQGVVGNPLLIEYTPNVSSPAVDGSTRAGVYDLFESVFGLLIDLDHAGNLRSDTEGWARGASDYAEDGNPLLAKPGGLKVED